MRAGMLMAAAMVALLGVQGGADVNLVSDGRTDYCVIVGKNASPSEHWAASELKQWIHEMSGATIPTSPDGPSVPDKAILVGDSEALRSLGVQIDFAALGDEGFAIKTDGDRLIIAGGKLRGTMYGVFKFLESLGCRFLTDTVNKIPKKPTITIDKLDISDKPAFEYRDVDIVEAQKPGYAARNASNSANAGLDAAHGGGVLYYPFVHSFAGLVPLDKYWDTHPEYYSEINGKRTRDNTQLCMSNPEVVKVATQQVLEWMREHPEAKICSVSQNDCYNNCQCPKCKAIDEEEGSPAGLMLRFVNAIAAETEKVYPDKLVDTLAYQWTENPPKITKPRANVRVRLCPIFCCESHPYESCDTPENKAFLKNLSAWGKLTDNLYIWHYNTDFSNYLNPFPDFRQLMETAKLYKKSGVKGIFWEGDYQTEGSEFSHLRAYLLTKISWNPDVDGNAVIKDFCDDYYGKAGPYILDYIQMMENKVTKDNIHMKIWAAPTDAYLTSDIIAKSDALFDKAEAVADSPEVLDRVREARLPIQYVKLMQPILRKETKGKEAALKSQLDTFVASCKHYGMTMINEGEKTDHFHERIANEIGK